MEKLTAQIAALYLGQRCEHQLGEVKTVFQIASVNVFGNVSDGDRFLVSCETIKPILRPLSSLTENEAREVYEAVYGFVGEEDVDDNDFLFFWNAPARFEIYRNERLWGYPNGWLKLLSLGFDLFGLIENGIAIDATKIETEKTD